MNLKKVTANKTKTPEEVKFDALIEEMRIKRKAFEREASIRQESLEKKIAFIARVIPDPGENEMEALAAGAMRYLNGEEELSVY